MNKELIKTYKAEFDHWLNGGKLLLKQINLVIPAEWEEFEEDWDWPIDELAVIINDELVEFRKALAEGKTLQYNFGNYGINRKDFPNTWKDLDLSIGILADRACPENYRIKPEEPKFKVGDWVRDGEDIYQFIEPSSIHSYESSLQRCELWQPKIGEWCWFWNKDRLHTVAQLVEVCNEGNRKYFASIPNKPHQLGGYYENCEPFLGQLPTSL